MSELDAVRARLEELRTDGAKAAMWRTDQIASLTKALEAVLEMADTWETKYGPGSKTEQILGPQKMSVKFGVQQIRAAIEKALIS